MRATGERIVSTGNLTVSTKGLQCLLSAGRATAVEIGTAAGARVAVGRRVQCNDSKIQKYMDEISELESKHYHEQI